MSAVENLARWRAAVDADKPTQSCRVCTPPTRTHAQYRADQKAKESAMPKLLAFAEAVLALAESPDGLTDPVITAHALLRLAEQHLEGAS